MSTALKDFLQNRAEKHKAETRAAKVTVDEWRAAVERLFAQFRAWLKEADPEGLIEIEENQEVINEPSLGRYRVPRLDLRFSRTWIGIIPKARYTMGVAKPPRNSVPERAAGRVDITDELRRYVMYRFQRDGGDVWVIDDLISELQPLDQEAFEKALINYLR